MNVSRLGREYVCSDIGLTGGIANMFVYLPITSESANPVVSPTMADKSQSRILLSLKAQWANTVAE